MCYKFKKTVPHRGFEPLISTVRVSCPGPARRMWLLSYVLSNTMQKYVFFLTRHRFFLLFSEEKVVIDTQGIDFLTISFISNQGTAPPYHLQKTGFNNSIDNKKQSQQGVSIRRLAHKHLPISLLLSSIISTHRVEKKSNILTLNKHLIGTLPYKVTQVTTKVPPRKDSQACLHCLAQSQGPYALDARHLHTPSTNTYLPKTFLCFSKFLYICIV